MTIVNLVLTTILLTHMQFNCSFPTLLRLHVCLLVREPGDVVVNSCCTVFVDPKLCLFGQMSTATYLLPCPFYFSWTRGDSPTSVIPAYVLPITLLRERQRLFGHVGL
ncbi:hypothetical protein BJ165DRAFT_1515963, partial [Panaeolus papilionaceus]